MSPDEGVDQSCHTVRPKSGLSSSRSWERNKILDGSIVDESLRVKKIIKVKSTNVKIGRRNQGLHHAHGFTTTC